MSRAEPPERGDEIDRANDRAQRFTDNAVAEAMRKSKPEQVVSPNGEYPVPDCVDCGDPIPLARLVMGRIRCVYCQSMVERGRLH